MYLHHHHLQIKHFLWYHHKQRISPIHTPIYPSTNANPICQNNPSTPFLFFFLHFLLCNPKQGIFFYIQKSISIQFENFTLKMHENIALFNDYFLKFLLFMEWFEGKLVHNKILKNA